MEKIKAYSKVNLALRVFKKRKNERLHRVDSVLVLYEKLFDIVEIRAFSTDQVIFRDMQVNGENTVSRALALFKEKFLIGDCYMIIVNKKIPIGSGLGGGSSDAAAVLCWLAKKYSVPHRLVLPLALKVGSDVPFFIGGHKCARITGFGGVVNPVACEWSVKKVITSEIVSLSKDVYARFSKLHLATHKVSISRFLSGNCEPFNDLQNAFLSLYPFFNDLLSTPVKSGEKLLLSGSGSSLAVLFKQ